MQSAITHTALCGKEIGKPLYEYQSPQIIELIDVSEFTAKIEQYSSTHRSFLMARMCLQAAIDYLTWRIFYPEKPITLDMFIYWENAPLMMKPEFQTHYYSGA